MKPGEREFIKEDKFKLDPKWGEEDFSRMKDKCVVCGSHLNMSKKRFITQGNYCLDCSSNCGENINHRVIKIKPDNY